jgi:ABC-2 type transport system permease protein
MSAIEGAVIAVVEREFKRFFRRRGQLLSTFARPLIWLVIVGAGFAALVPDRSQFSYREYLVPGIFGMVILFSTFLSALGTVHDREFGPIRMLLIAPVPRSAVVGAKTAASTLLAAAQCLPFLVLIPIFGLDPSDEDLASLVVGIFLTALALSCVGMLIASLVRSLENFAVVMNFVIFPMFFLSGSLYPVSSLPGYLEPIARANPLTYGVDFMREALLDGLGEFSGRTNVIVLLAISAYTVGMAASLFGREEHLGRILLTGAPRRAELWQRLLNLLFGRRAEPAAAPAEAAAMVAVNERLDGIQTRLDDLGVAITELRGLVEVALRRELAREEEEERPRAPTESLP